jgi:SHS2 domain-containing protein
MAYEYLEHGVTSDVTFRAWGNDLDALFTAAADATTNVMVGALDSVAPAVSRPLSLSAEALDLLLMHFLDEIVFYKDAESLFLRASEVHVTQAADGFHLRAMLKGEAIDPAKHDLAGDVKGVTLHGLRVARSEEGWQAEVTLDV